MTAPTNEEYAEMARERRAEWDRSIKWAKAAAKKCDEPSTVALLLAMRQEYFLIDFERFARRVREITARMEMERLTDELSRCSERCARLSGEGKQGMELVRILDRHIRENRRWDALSKQYDAAQERWVKELGI